MRNSLRRSSVRLCSRWASKPMARAFSDSAPGAPLQLWTRLIPLAFETPAPHDVPAFLRYFAELPPLQVRLALLGYRAFAYERLAPPETVFLAAQGDEAAIHEVAAKHFPRDRMRREALIGLLAGIAPARRAAQLHPVDALRSE